VGALVPFRLGIGAVASLRSDVRVPRQPPTPIPGRATTPARATRPARDETSPVMANIKSQIKRNRQNLARHERNKAVRSRLKTFSKRFAQAVEAGDREAAEEAFRTTSRALDKAATKGVIHKNNAANKKSRMAKKLSSLSS
jgi:small subunit ribosomal protein S20